MGQHNLAADKREPYDTDIRIPFYIKGPGVTAGRSLPYVTGMVDLPPTIMQLAGLATAGSDRWDGRSFAELVAPGLSSDGGGGVRGDVPDHFAPTWARQEYLIAYMACSQPAKVTPNDRGHAKDVGNNTFIGLRIINKTANLAYFEFTDAYTDWNFEAVDFFELFDLTTDPHQLHNLYYRSPMPSVALRQELHERLRKAWACRGADCF